MKPVWPLAALALAISTAGPASATIVRYEYAGIIGVLSDPAHSGGVNVGDVARVLLEFDPADLVDVTAAAQDAFGVTYDHLEAAPLVGPGARLKVAIGPNSFTEADQFAGAGDPFKIGGGPHVLFEGGKFFGIQFFGVNAKGAAFVTAGAAPEPFDFAGGDFSAGGPSYAGDFDYAKVKVTSVPEPAAWTLMICGFGAAGAVLRRRRGVSGQWSSHGI